MRPALVAPAGQSAKDRKLRHAGASGRTAGESILVGLCAVAEKMRSELIFPGSTPCVPAWSASAHASLVELPRQALGADDHLLTRHELYDRLGRTAAARQRAYRELFRDALDPGLRR